MRTATIREFRNNYARLLRWVKAGEEIVITRRGEPVARLVPETVERQNAVSWADSPALTRDRSAEKTLSAEETARLFKESSGRW